MKNDDLYQGIIQKSRKSWILEIFCKWSWREFADGMTVEYNETKVSGPIEEELSCHVPTWGIPYKEQVWGRKIRKAISYMFTFLLICFCLNHHTLIFVQHSC